MLYLLGGASRAGKSIIARRFVDELKIPYFSVDYLVTAFAQGAPEAGIDHEQLNIERAENLWPKLKPMLINILEAEPHYLVDGDALLPKHVSELLKEHSKNMHVCFVGYSIADPNQKLKEIRQYTGVINDWTKDHDDSYVLRHIKEMIEFSRYLKTECERLNLPYIDVSHDFDRMLAAAFESLKGTK